MALTCSIWSDDLLVNSPLNIINYESRVLELLSSGRIRHILDEVMVVR